MAKFVFSAFADEAANEFSEQIRALKENDIHYIEPRSANGTSVLSQTPEEWRELRRMLDEADIRVYSFGSPIGKFSIDEDFETHLTDFRRALDCAHALGTDKIRMFSFFVPQDRLLECRDEVMRRMSIMLDMAEEAGITLCHENESRIYGQMPNEVEDLLDTLPKLEGIFDAANYRMNNADVLCGIDVTLKRLAYVHVKDAIYETQTIVPAGEGEGRYAEVLAKIDAATDETVVLTLEPHLFLFDAYKQIDAHELRGKYAFKNKREAFDFAVRALEKLLTENGYRKGENAVWSK